MMLFLYEIRLAWRRHKAMNCAWRHVMEKYGDRDSPPVELDQLRARLNEACAAFDEGTAFVGLMCMVDCLAARHEREPHGESSATP